MRRPKLRSEPRFGANKLAEYMTAGPAKRRSLIVDQIVSPATKILNYEHARAAARRILSDPSRSANSWMRAASRLRDMAANTPDEFDARCMRLSAQALEAFAPSSNLIRTGSAVVVAGRRQWGALTLAGVRVSLSPEASLLEVGSERRIGAIQFHFAKTTLKTEGLQYVGAMLVAALTQSGDTPRRSMCTAVDAFSGVVIDAPRAMKARMKDIESACEEIAERWPALYSEQVAKYAELSDR